MGKKRKYVSISVDSETSISLKATTQKVQRFGYGNLPSALQRHFGDGVTNSAIIRAALAHLEETCLNDREPSAE